MLQEIETVQSGVSETQIAILNLVLWQYWFEPEINAILYTPEAIYIGPATEIMGPEPIDIIGDDGLPLGGPEPAKLGEFGSIPKAVFQTVAVLKLEDIQGCDP